ncbi:MAG: hypothetical protein F6K16_33335 [Symploca sp. SIO2B6]|nr:hypothetical protein [Symploca sp. SIO2B6]
MRIPSRPLKTSKVFSLAVLTVSLLGIHSVFCQASPAQALNTQEQQIHEINTDVI